jgi:signal transduction histidine kinase
VLIEKSDREGFVDTPAWRQFLLIAKKLRDEINTIYEVLRRGFNDSYKAQQPGRAAKQSPDTAIKTLSSEARYAQSVGDEQIKLNVDVKRAFSVHFPRGRLMQVIDNLVRNSEYWLRTPLARKAVPKPQITIQVAKPIISIWDNGIGVKPEIEDRVFDMFVSDKPRETGRGLGLYITREILLRYGCEITLADHRNTHDRRYRFDIDLSPIAQ